MPEGENTIRIKKLTIAVWFLGIMVLLNISITIYTIFYLHIIPKKASTYITSSDKPIIGKAYQDPYMNFGDWDIDRKVKEASVILLTKWEESDEKLKCIITEILKMKPETVFYYKVGQEFSTHSIYPRENTSYGEGMVMFLTGSPASMRYSTTLMQGRIRGFGDMPLKFTAN